MVKKTQTIRISSSGLDGLIKEAPRAALRVHAGYRILSAFALFIFLGSAVPTGVLRGLFVIARISTKLKPTYPSSSNFAWRQGATRIGDVTHMYTRYRIDTVRGIQPLKGLSTLMQLPVPLSIRRQVFACLRMLFKARPGFRAAFKSHDPMSRA